MNCKIEIIPRLLHFKQPAGTSRGTYTTRKVWYLHFTSPDFPGRVGIGECAPLPALSCDDLPDYEDILKRFCRQVEKEQGMWDKDVLCQYPSILFGLETAIWHFFAGSWALSDTAFSRGEVGIQINGLIWMGDFDHMLSQIEKKMEAGFRCVKLKIGAIDFEKELALLRHIRTHFSSKEIELRVDANGAFSPGDAMEKLKRLSEFDLHSIEQPIRAGQWEEMARLTSESPLPIALDEELIGCNMLEEKKKQEQQNATAEPAKTVEVKSHTRQRKTKATRKELYANLPVREIVIPLTEEERHCPYCNAEMTTIGYTDVREELRITPAKVERILYKQEVAVCPECRKDGDGTLVKATTPTALFPHSPASASIVAYVMYHKTFVGTPYYRQESGMFQLGVKLPRETMANWCIQGAGKYFYPLFERMHELLIQRELIHADETTCQVLREEGKAAESISYMWIYLSGNDGLPPIILYDYQAGRAGKYAQQFLEGFHGMLQCDGYQGYNKVDNVLLVCCLAHCRRKFYEAIPAERRKKLKLLDINSEEEIKEPLLPKKEEIPSMIPAEVGLAYCNKLFSLEKL